MSAPTTDGEFLTASSSTDGSGVVSLTSSRNGAVPEPFIPEEAVKLANDLLIAAEQATRDGARFAEGAAVRRVSRHHLTYVVLGLSAESRDSLACRRDSNGYVYTIPIRLLEASP